MANIQQEKNTKLLKELSRTGMSEKQQRGNLIGRKKNGETKRTECLKIKQTMKHF